jgi:hypothetical protein
MRATVVAWAVTASGSIGAAIRTAIIAAAITTTAIIATFGRTFSRTCISARLGASFRTVATWGIAACMFKRSLFTRSLFTRGLFARWTVTSAAFAGVVARWYATRLGTVANGTVWRQARPARDIRLITNGTTSGRLRRLLAWAALVATVATAFTMATSIFARLMQCTTALRRTILSWPILWRPILPWCVVGRGNLAAIKRRNRCQWLTHAAQWPTFGHTLRATAAFGHNPCGPRGLWPCGVAEARRIPTRLAFGSAARITSAFPAS